MKLMLRGALSLAGNLIPPHPPISEPVVGEIEASGLRFTEKWEPLAPR